jgi:hypothetical protein
MELVNQVIYQNYTEQNLRNMIQFLVKPSALHKSSDAIKRGRENCEEQSMEIHEQNVQNVDTPDTDTLENQKI